MICGSYLLYFYSFNFFKGTLFPALSRDEECLITAQHANNIRGQTHRRGAQVSRPTVHEEEAQRRLTPRYHR